MTIVPSVADNLRGDHWRTEALSREFQSALSIPLEYDDFVYGVLTVYAQQEDGFGEMPQEVYAGLGETIAMRYRRLSPDSGGPATGPSSSNYRCRPHSLS